MGIQRVAAGAGLAFIIWLAIRSIVPLQPDTWEIEPPDPGNRDPGSPADTTYVSRPLPSKFEDRRQELFRIHAAHEGGDIHDQLIRLHLGLSLEQQAIESALVYLDKRLDTADFRLAGLLRLLYQFSDSASMDPDTIDRIRQSILEFKYWPDEPGQDDMCTWSENHYILFSSGAYLAGRLFQDSLFTNSGVTGLELAERAKPRILKWLDLRYKTGYSEWLSNVYYAEDIAPLLNIIDFADDEVLVQKATMVLDLTLLDMALNHFEGTFGSTHGRSYARHKMDGAHESTAPIYRLLFGLNALRSGNMASISLALSSKYRLPEVIYRIAGDTTKTPLENRQRMGIRIEEADRWGLDPDRLEDGMTFLTLEAYSHPKTINLTFDMFDQYGWWENTFFKPFAPYRKPLSAVRRLGLAPTLASLVRSDLSRNSRPEVNIYTYRTSDYMLSTAQDWEKARGGDQQHIWSATLGPQAMVFTTHPARFDGPSPNYWTGSGNLPRVAQHKNVAVILYKTSRRPGLYVTHELDFTHAWFPKDRFDRIRVRNGWFFGQKDNGYVALWSQKPAFWRESGVYKDQEIVAPGRRNVWICEMGSESDFGSFDAFVDRISDAELHSKGLSLTYSSPSLGEVFFDWDSPLAVNGGIIDLRDYPRYSNPYVTTEFPADQVEIKAGDAWLILEYEAGTRSFSDLIK